MDEKKAMSASRSPAGAPIESCESDDLCESLSCEECMAQIPPSALLRPEGEDYARRHCGDECVERMRSRGEGKAS